MGGIKMFGRQRTVTCQRGEWTTVIRTWFAQIPVAWTVHVANADGEIAGEVEETKSAWIFPGTPSNVPLTPEMVFKRGYWNTFYLVRIRPVDTVTVTIK